MLQKLAVRGLYSIIGCFLIDDTGEERSTNLQEGFGGSR